MSPRDIIFANIAFDATTTGPIILLILGRSLDPGQSILSIGIGILACTVCFVGCVFVMMYQVSTQSRSTRIRPPKDVTRGFWNRTKLRFLSLAVLGAVLSSAIILNSITVMIISFVFVLAYVLCEFALQ